MSRTRVTDAMLPRGAGAAGEVVPVPAASVILLRGEPFEVLMMRRHESSTFVPGAWVFPGGALDAADTEIAGEKGEEAALAICAVRELLEEAGIWLGGGDADAASRRAALAGDPSLFRTMAEDARAALPRLVPFERWITPAGIPKRYDTLFVLARTDDDSEGSPDELEGVELAWIRPADALARQNDGSMQLVFATIRILETLTSFASAAELVAACGARALPVRRPMLVIADGRKSIVLQEGE
ncbi:MAG: NUDIX domain-containing protein [Acidobacteria bacterium]|nr:NUDIX domain-containing protein [Acidobacteriota bacterium]